MLVRSRALRAQPCVACAALRHCNINTSSSPPSLSMLRLVASSIRRTACSPCTRSITTPVMGSKSMRGISSYASSQPSPLTSSTTALVSSNSNQRYSFLHFMTPFHSLSRPLSSPPILVCLFLMSLSPYPESTSSPYILRLSASVFFIFYFCFFAEYLYLSSLFY